MNSESCETDLATFKADGLDSPDYTTASFCTLSTDLTTVTCDYFDGQDVTGYTTKCTTAGGDVVSMMTDIDCPNSQDYKISIPWCMPRTCVLEDLIANRLGEEKETNKMCNVVIGQLNANPSSRPLKPTSLMLSSTSLSSVSRRQNTSCDSNKSPVLVQVDITTGRFPHETTWKVINDSTRSIVYEGGPYETTSAHQSAAFSVCPQDCLRFEIHNSFADGSYSPGSYQVSYNHVLAKEGDGAYGEEQSSIPFGTGCISAEPPTSSPFRNIKKEKVKKSKKASKTRKKGKW